MNADENDGVYGSGLNDDDWAALRDVMWPFIHTDDPASVDIPAAPSHLENHPLVESIRQYKKTGEDRFLDQAGRSLVPTETEFGWYEVLTK